MTLAASPVNPPVPGHLIQLAGDVDMARRSELDALLAGFVDSASSTASIDLAEVTFLDSTGLAFLAQVRNVCRSRGGSVTLLHPNPAVLRTLTLVGFHLVFDVVGD